MPPTGTIEAASHSNCWLWVEPTFSGPPQTMPHSCPRTFSDSLLAFLKSMLLNFPCQALQNLTSAYLCFVIPHCFLYKPYASITSANTLFSEQVWKLPAFGHVVPFSCKVLTQVKLDPFFRDWLRCQLFCNSHLAQEHVPLTPRIPQIWN